MKRIAIINGPNLNMLGKREKSIYGNSSLSDLETEIKNKFAAKAEVSFFQSNSEADLVDYIHSLHDSTDRIIINAAAFTHTSIAIRDALAAVDIPFIEVHISNVYKRESFRHHSYLSGIAVGVITGLGFGSYHAALDFFLNEDL